MRIKLLWAVLLLILVVMNGLIYQREQILAHGETVLLKLAPVDPRSLMQGDYMALRYALAADIAAAVLEETADGVAVVQLNGDRVARFARIHAADSALAANEQLLQFRKRQAGVRIATDAFFFQEGDAGKYEQAQYGEFKVSPAGDAVLIGLRDEHLQPLGRTAAAQ